LAASLTGTKYWKDGDLNQRSSSVAVGEIVDSPNSHLSNFA
jgi:hypothetical protein